MFGIDWTGDGQVDFIDDIISMDVMGFLDDEEKEDENDDFDDLDDFDDDAVDIDD